MRKNHEVRYYWALSDMLNYRSAANLKHVCKKAGLTYEAALEEAYQELLDRAKSAIKGHRCPGPRWEKQ